MHISPINFCGRTEYFYGNGSTKQERLQDLGKETKMAFIARSKGVDAPAYHGIMSKAKEHETGVRYEPKGEHANTKTNPITPEHIKRLFQNFAIMDKIGFCHQNLSSSNIYYSDEGNVEIASMRDVIQFHLADGQFSYRNEDLPSYVMPSNAENFEAASLCKYVHNLKYKFQKQDLIKEYLTNKGEYSEFRAQLLKDMGFEDTDKTMLYETVQSQVFKAPSSDVLDYFIDKFEISRERDVAKILWRKGSGYIDGQVEPKERFASVVVLLKVLNSTLALRDRAELLSQSSNTPEERQYFAFEKETLDIWAKNIYDKAKATGADNFCNKTFAENRGLYLGCKEDREVFDEFFGDINIEDNSTKAKEAIDRVVEYYINLIDDWSPENNEMYKIQYFKQAVGA